MSRVIISITCKDSIQAVIGLMQFQKKSNSGLEKICVDHNNEIRLGTRC